MPWCVVRQGRGFVLSSNLSDFITLTLSGGGLGRHALMIVSQARASKCRAGGIMWADRKCYLHTSDLGFLFVAAEESPEFNVK